MFNHTILKERLEIERQAKGWSISKLAREIELSEGGVRYLIKNSNPTAENLYKLAVALEVSTDYLLGLKDERN
ncbi:helix-turn-helix domain-containing protein [Mammaliicoccus sciuri]|uniref:helix-turn-helix domain-containing protein n=1 Tax=Mammaliicoccus sciuri TaxID=1296 RepID=UPI0034DD7F56